MTSRITGLTTITMNNPMEYKALRVIISGGGTGGHIFPAVSIANKLKELNPETEILFVGAEGKMEMEKVPAAGYKIIGLPITGLHTGSLRLIAAQGIGLFSPKSTNSLVSGL